MKAFNKGLTAAVGIMMLLGTSALPASAEVEPARQAASSAAAGYRIGNEHSKKAIAVRGASSADGAQVVQYSYTAAAPHNDLIYIEQARPGDPVRLKAAHSYKCLAVEGASLAQGAFVNQYNCTYDTIDNDVWWERPVAVQTGSTIKVRFEYVNVRSGLCLTVQGASTANNARLLQYPCDRSVTAPHNDLWYAE